MKSLPADLKQRVHSALSSYKQHPEDFITALTGAVAAEIAIEPEAFIAKDSEFAALFMSPYADATNMKVLTDVPEGFSEWDQF